jgi:hypothetical protein
MNKGLRVSYTNEAGNGAVGIYCYGGKIMNNNKLIKIILLIEVIVFITISCSKKSALENIETDEILISVSYADESFFEKYMAYDSFIEHEDYGHKIAFIPNVPVKDFSWLLVGYKYDDDLDFVYDDDGGHVYVVEEELYRLEELHPQKPLVVSWVEVGIISVFGFSYRDKDGEKKYFVGQVGNYGGDPEEYDGPDFKIWQFFPQKIVIGRYQYTQELPNDEATFILDITETSYTLKINDIVYKGTAVIDFGDIGAEKHSWYVTLEGIKWAQWDRESFSEPSGVFLWLEEGNELVFQNMGNPMAAYTIFSEIDDKWVRLTNTVPNSIKLENIIDYNKTYADLITEWKTTNELEGYTAYYAFYDIDGNGIKELILRIHNTHYYDAIEYIYSIKDGKPINVFGYSDNGEPIGAPSSRYGSSVILNNGLIDSSEADYSIYKIASDGYTAISIAKAEPYDYPDEASRAEAKWRYFIGDKWVDDSYIYIEYLNEQGYKVNEVNTEANIDWH